jgi:hypothetical protein
VISGGSISAFNLETLSVGAWQMTSFRKLWTTFVDAIKPQAMRNSAAGGLHSIYVDSRPFSSSFRER